MGVSAIGALQFNTPAWPDYGEAGVLFERAFLE
jgi:hypothetical protein